MKNLWSPARLNFSKPETDEKKFEFEFRSGFLTFFGNPLISNIMLLVEAIFYDCGSRSMASRTNSNPWAAVCNQCEFRSDDKSDPCSDGSGSSAMDLPPPR